jgi:hypothetical protein
MREDMRDEMGMFRPRASCDVPPTERRLVHTGADNPSRGSLQGGVRGRARGNSLVEDPSVCWLAMSESSLAAHEAGGARAGEDNLLA